MTVRTTGKKIALGFAIACLACMALSLAAFVYLVWGGGMQDVMSASALATTLFFASCALVLFLMSKPPRHELLRWDENEGASGEASDTNQP